MDKRDLGEKPEIRSDEDGSSYIEGYAIVFNRESKDLGGFTEIVDPSAMIDADVSDIMGRYNHEVLIGRTTTGTMTYSIDDEGVRYSIKLPNTDYPGKYVKEMVERKDINGSSFAFDVKKGGDKWVERSDGTMYRTISSFSKIYDMGPVDNPAYADTTSAMRSMEKYKAVKEKNELSQMQKAERVKELRNLELFELEILEQ